MSFLLHFFRRTVKPKDVPARMKKLLAEYNAKQNVTVDDIIAFHAEFEKIHPFQDGNRRIGRLVVLKECLRFGIVPFLIEDTKKRFTIAVCQSVTKKRAVSLTHVLTGRIHSKHCLRCLK